MAPKSVTTFGNHVRILILVSRKRKFSARRERKLSASGVA
jgi:hypothetical protein